MHAQTATFYLLCFDESRVKLNKLSPLIFPNVVFEQQDSARETTNADTGFNMSLWVHFNIYGRSGNKVRQIMDVKEILSRCSGVASSELQSNGDPVLAFPPVLFAMQGSPNDPSRLLSLAAQECEEVSWSWDQVETLAKKCSSHPVYDISVPVDQMGSSSPGLLANVFAEHAFWKHQITTMGTMVMYFRGGDILMKDASPAYSQGPCSLFLESWKAANVSRAVLVYDHNDPINPCVEVVREAIGNTNIVPTPCDSAGCHMMMVGRARYVVVSGFTTFARAGFDLFPGRQRIIFRYFCNKRVPHVSQWGLEICVDGESDGLVPWSYTDETRHTMIKLPSRVVLGDMNASTFQQYLHQGDNDHLTSRGMRI